MSKNSPFPEEKRKSSDGALSVHAIAPMLRRGDEVAAEDEEGVVSFLLDDVPVSVLDLLAVGQAVAFARERRRLAVVAARRRVGLVPRRYISQVKDAVSTGHYVAWISELPHRSVRVTLKW